MSFFSQPQSTDLPNAKRPDLVEVRPKAKEDLIDKMREASKEDAPPRHNEYQPPVHPAPPSVAKRLNEMTEGELYAELADGIWHGGGVLTYRRGLDCLNELYRRAGWAIPESDAQDR